MRKILRKLRMSPWQVFVRSTLICTLLGAVFLGIALRKIERLPLDGAPLEFDPKRAHQTMTRLAKDFPFRLPWHVNRHRAIDWLKGEFKKLDLEPQEMVFSEVIAGQQYSDLRNIYAEIPGSEKPEEIVVMMAHFDTTDTTAEGAMDDASGVGVVLELARIFSKPGFKPRRTLLFLLTDSEEFGAFWGAEQFARSFERRNQIIATANFDFVGPMDQVAILTLCDGLKSGYTPLWLREMALDSIRSTGSLDALDTTNIVEFIQRAILIPAADHGPFLREGIPAFNWVGQMKNFAYQMAHFHHTEHDKAEIMKVESFDSYGKAAEKLIRSLDRLPNIPENFRDSSYIKVTQTLYLDGWAMFFLKVLAFIPFLLYSFVRFGSTLIRHPKNLLRRVMKNELKGMAILLGSFLMGYLVMRLLPALKIITQYESFPATQKSEILYNPNFLAITIVILFIVFVNWLFRRVFQDRVDDADYRDIRHAVHAVFLALLIIVSFIGNSYLACLLLLPPAYFWTAVKKDRPGESSRWVNALLIFGGSITLVIMSIVMSTIFHVGVIYWYLFLAATYGLVSVLTVVLFCMAMTIMIRIARAFVFRN